MHGVRQSVIEIGACCELEYMPCAGEIFCSVAMRKGASGDGADKSPRAARNSLGLVTLQPRLAKSAVSPLSAMHYAMGERQSQLQDGGAYAMI